MSALPEVVVVYGGVGPEREVSLESGKAVLEALMASGRWVVRGLILNEKGIPAGVDAAKDVVFPVLHGEFGEDGVFQKLLVDRGICYAGCDSTSSALCMDKYGAKAIARSVGVKGARDWLLSGVGDPSPRQVISRLGEHIVAKPVAMGSSVGLEILNGESALAGFMKQRSTIASGWLLEERIVGREFSVGVLGGVALSVVEIVVPGNGVFDYRTKYQSEETRYECPARLPEALTSQLRDCAGLVFKACGCRDFGRVDFLIEQGTNRICFLEINTLPGMTSHSLLPKSAAGSGFGFVQLVERMVEPATARYRQNRPSGARKPRGLSRVASKGG